MFYIKHCFGGDDYSVVDQQGGEYEINPRDKQRQRHNERRRNKVIHGASTSLGSRFRCGPDAKDLSDIFVYHVACDSTIGDVKGHLKQQVIPVQQIRIDITSNKDSMYKSFRVIAPGTYKDILMSPEVWPVGVKVTEYESHIPDAGIQAVNLRMNHMEVDDLKSRNGSKIMYI